MNSEDFIKAYVHAALWYSSDDSDTPLYENHKAEELPRETLVAMKTDCSAFLEASDIPIELWSMAGHDFWLTRNGHGSGFWDRPEIYGEEKAQELTALAETFGPVDLYVGDDGSIYA